MGRRSAARIAASALSISSALMCATTLHRTASSSPGAALRTAEPVGVRSERGLGHRQAPRRAGGGVLDLGRRPWRPVWTRWPGCGGGARWRGPRPRPAPRRRPPPPSTWAASGRWISRRGRDCSHEGSTRGARKRARRGRAANLSTCFVSSIVLLRNLKIVLNLLPGIFFSR